MAQALAEGHVEGLVGGSQAQGGYPLIRTHQGQEERWLLGKMKDDEVDAHRNLINTEREWVLGERTLAEFKAKEENPAEIWPTKK